VFVAVAVAEVEVTVTVTPVEVVEVPPVALAARTDETEVHAGFLLKLAS
jgi:hypothetical protein